MHQALAGTLDSALAQIRRIQSEARSLDATQTPERPRWPMIVLRTPKGWTGPKFVDGKPVEGSWRSHQVPIAEFKTPGHLQQLEDWLKSYRPQELFDERGKFLEELATPQARHRRARRRHAGGPGLALDALRADR